VRLEKLFRNGIIEAVEKGGLARRECTFDFNDDGGCYITHGPSGSSFVVKGPFGRHTTIAVVGEGAPRQLDAYIWPKVEERAEGWARDVKRDVDTPDLWAELHGQREVLTGARYEDVENTPFTPDEQTEIAQQLQQIKGFVKEEHSLSEAQMRSLEGKLDYIEAATGRIGRKDWRILFYGVMFEVIVTALLPEHAVRDILTIAVRGLDYLLGGGGGPPELPPTELPPMA
jgi:hypothetical protein